MRFFFALILGTSVKQAREAGDSKRARARLREVSEERNATCHAVVRTLYRTIYRSPIDNHARFEYTAKQYILLLAKQPEHYIARYIETSSP